MNQTRRGFLGLVGGTVAAGAAGFKAAEASTGKRAPLEAPVPDLPNFGPLDCRWLWTLETYDPQVRMMIGAGDRDGLRAKISAHYGMLQYLQIFRQSAVVWTEEVINGSWVKYLHGLAQQQFHMINQHLLHGKASVIRGGVVDECSDHNDAKMRSFRLMDGWTEFMHRGVPKDMGPGLMFLRGRLFNILEPYPLYNYATGEEREQTMGLSIISEVALGLRPKDEAVAKRLGWRERTMMDEVTEKMEATRKPSGGAPAHAAGPRTARKPK